MVKSPTRTCPNLSRLVAEAEPALLTSFLKSRAFDRLTWLDRYRPCQDDKGAPVAASEMITNETKERLRPLEDEAARVVTIAGNRGNYALEGLAESKLSPDRAKELLNQRDDMARSLWAYVNELALFEAAENSLHLRLYRRYDKHYQTFMAEPSVDGAPDAGDARLRQLLDEIKEALDRGDGYNIEKYELPEEGDEPAAEMFLLYHPDRPASVREIDEEGNRSKLYFRPPGEAMIVYTPSTGRVHVRAGNRKLRHLIAERFINTALSQNYSNQPVDFQAYDISRFRNGFELDPPEMADATILRARVIRADISIGNLANRLSLSTTIDQDISEIIETQPGLSRIFGRAVAIRFVEIAVRYRRPGRTEPQTLDFTITDRNTTSLLSVDDPFERVLGHRLLRQWGILREGRAPTPSETMAAIPALLALWDMGLDKVSGAWLLDRNVDATLLTELGFLVPAGWEGDDLIDDEDEVGPATAEVIATPGEVDLKVSEGQAAPGGDPERYRIYRVRDGWVAEHLRARLEEVLDTPAVEELSRHLWYLGTLATDGGEAPVYLARSLDQEKVCSAVDTELRSRSHLGIGLVLQAGNAPVRALGPMF